jgi:hypothetical protein
VALTATYAPPNASAQMAVAMIHVSGGCERNLRKHGDQPQEGRGLGRGRSVVSRLLAVLPRYDQAQPHGAVDADRRWAAGARYGRRRVHPPRPELHCQSHRLLLGDVPRDRRLRHAHPVRWTKNT